MFIVCTYDLGTDRTGQPGTASSGTHQILGLKGFSDVIDKYLLVLSRYVLYLVVPP